MKRLTDVIKEEQILSWKLNDNILIEAPMGAGKSYFCKNTLYDIAKRNNEKILMLIHRANCVQQFQYELESDGKTDVITVITYQALEYADIHNTKKYDLSNYTYIICDEFHYFFNDSQFNNKTAISFNLIMAQKNVIRIFMSATGNQMARYMRKYIRDNKLVKEKRYEMESDYSFINTLSFFFKDNTMNHILLDCVNKNEKCIFFIHSAEKAYKLFSENQKYCIFNCSKNNPKYYKYVDEEIIVNILKEEKFNDLILITTTCFDAGINIIDTDVKNIVVDINDIGSMIQCIGRKRIQNENDKINVYVHANTNQSLAGLRRVTQSQIEMADYFHSVHYAMDKLIEKYPRQNDLNNILYDDFLRNSNGVVDRTGYVKKINELMFFKKKEDMAIYSLMMKQKFGYCTYVAKLLGFYDEVSERYTYNMMNEEYELESYLRKMAEEKIVLYQVKDRKDLIKQINAKQNGKLLKKASTLNQILEEREIDYRIKEYSTSQMITNPDGTKKKKKYNSAWKIVKF